MVHTVQVPASVMPEGLPLLSLDAQLIEDCEDELQKIGENVRNEFGSSFKVATFCLSGSLNPLVNELVKTQAVDLVVMGTHGAGNLLDTFLGTTTSSFIKAAHCPVLVVPAHATFTPILRMAYASDFETEETAYLKQLFPLASSLGAQVSIINIKSEKQLNIVSDYQALTRINKLFPQNRYSVSQLKHDDVLAGLKEFVLDNQIELLAVSIQDRGLLEELFHHSFTKELALRAFVPFLTLPANSYHFQNQRASVRKTVFQEGLT